MVSFFLQHIKYEKRLSQHTLLAYQTDLEQFVNYLKAQYDFEHLALADSPMIRSWVASLVEAKMDNTSINRKIATLRSFYGYALRQKVILADPMLKIQALKTPKNIPSFVKEKEMDTLLDDIPFTEDFFGLRDKLVLELLYGTGIRLAELIGLKESDINLYEKTILVLGKRNKHRIIPLNNTLFALIKKYQESKKLTFEVADNHLIITNMGLEAYPMLIQRITKKYLSLVTTLEKKSPHVLRHTFATNLLTKGADLNAIKDLLGHTSLAATQVYTHNSMEKLKQEYELAHPKA